MNDFIFHNPTRIVFGKTALNNLGLILAENKIRKPLLIYGKGSIKANGVYSKILKEISSIDISFEEFSGIQSNPTLTKVIEAIELARQYEVDAILAIGGGSVIDSAKAIAAGYYYNGNIWDIFEGKGKVEKALPIFTVLTISATASEMNPGAVITNEAENKKWAFAAGEFTSPKVSFIDPSLQASLPKEQTAYGAIDAITHVLEYYFNGVENVDFQDELSESIIRTILKHAPILYNDPDNYESRAQLAWCSTMALNGMNAVGRFGGDFATHTIEHSLSAFYPEIAHAAGLAILFPNWMKFVSDVVGEKIEKLGANVFNCDPNDLIRNSEYAIEKTQNFFKSLGVQLTLASVGVKEADLVKIAENATQNGSIGRLMKLNKEDVLKILNNSYS